MGRAMLTRSMAECTELLSQSIVTLTGLQEDPTLRRLETEARELQQAYDQLRGTAQTIAITQRLAKIREAQDLKIQADAARQKEAVVKDRLQPWLDEAFAVSTTIERKVAHMQAEYATMETTETGTEVSATHVERM